MKLEGKVAVVTGAGGGSSGRAVARRFAREGAWVVVSDINDAGGRETVRLIEASGGRATFFQADIGVEEQVRALIAFTEKTYGGVDILANNGGMFWPEPLGHWFETVQVTLLSVMYATFYAIEAMRRRGGGAIVNYGSTSTLAHGRNHSPSPAYDVAKAGVIRLTTTLGWLREKENIRVNCIVPGWIANDEIRAYVDGLTLQQRKERDVPDQLLTLEEIAGHATRLVTDESLAGRVLVCFNGQPPRFIPAGDPGYASLHENVGDCA